MRAPCEAIHEQNFFPCQVFHFICHNERRKYNNLYKLYFIMDFLQLCLQSVCHIFNTVIKDLKSQQPQIKGYGNDGKKIMKNLNIIIISLSVLKFIIYFETQFLFLWAIFVGEKRIIVFYIELEKNYKNVCSFMKYIYE